MIDNKIIKKITDLCLIHELEYSKLDITAINLTIKTTYLQLEYLYDNKPLFFKKKELIEYNKKVKNLEDKILNCYDEIEKELKIIKTINDSLKN